MAGLYKTHKNMEMIVAEWDCDGQARNFKLFLNRRYPSLKVTLIENQTGGSGLFDVDGNDTDNANHYWEMFCKN